MQLEQDTSPPHTAANTERQPASRFQPTDAALSFGSFEAAEFLEYEREFKKYTSENLRSQRPGDDFATLHQDTDDELREKIACLTEWWREAKHVVVYTGAGVSTAAGLPDYRGPEGVWTRKVRGEAIENFDCDELSVFTPTRSHVALARLQQAGFLAHVVTTNVDGLHSKAGLPSEALSELHGNSFVELCRACGKRFERGYVTRTATGLFEHKTGKVCESCGGALYDNIVNFGNTFEHVPSMEEEHDRAWVQTLKADLVVVLGSSLSVQTACDLPEECLPPRSEKPKGGRLVIVNLQRTPKDSLAALQIFAPCDDAIGPIEHALLSC